VKREYYSDTISGFLQSSTEEIVGKLVLGSDFPDTLEQRAAWVEEIKILRSALGPHSGAVYFEYSIPRMGERIDVLLIIGPVIFVLEFKTGAQVFSAYAVDQVTDRVSHQDPRRSENLRHLTRHILHQGGAPTPGDFHFAPIEELCGETRLPQDGKPALEGGLFRVLATKEHATAIIMRAWRGYWPWTRARLARAPLSMIPRAS